MPASSYDCVVIGSGPGGYVGAIRAAQLGMKTAVIEQDKVGGRCLNYACIPAKAILRVADVLSEVRGAGDFGISVGEPQVDYAAVGARREKVVGTLTGGVASLLEKNRIELIEGHGALAASGGVEVAGRTLSARTVVLATGSIARTIPGAQFGGRVIGTEEAWALPELPRSLAIVGAGASGAEIASAYARFGVEVELYEALERVLPTEDAEISKVVDRGLKRQGITIHTGTLVENVESTGRGVKFTSRETRDPSSSPAGEELGSKNEADWLVIAAGRGPDVESLALDLAGVKLAPDGLIEVDGALRTSATGIYAIGDLVHGPALAHKASEEGLIASQDAAGIHTHPIAYIDIPRATFCAPNVASFGLTEAQAREQGHDVVVGRLQYGAVGAGTIYGDRTGIVKIVGEKKYGELLGAHIAGTRATELIGELVLVRGLEGGFPEIARAIHAHPTFSEAVMEAARAADGWLIHG
ncbi:MAG: dihydrolipoyl dehydrogenase [Actinomycetota bacterium]|nr:dihydrolipoyl dehydrogenase [Actinomycetota bacterium]